jgi:hypothetical protein
MNWKLILQLSLYGLAMGIATVFFISSAVEPVCWLAIFVICAIAIARGAPGRPFLHGVAVGLVNSVWVTASHVLLFDQYIARHAREAAMMRAMPMFDSPRLMMMLTGPVIGFVSGIILGIFAVVAAHFIVSNPAGARPAGSGAA